MATLARCYGNRQLSFQGQAWGPVPVPGMQHGTPGGAGLGTLGGGAGLGTLGLSLLLSAASLISPLACQ